MTRGRLVVHAHFYQPYRADPFGGPGARDPSAAPYPDWTTRIAAECYRPIAERGTLAHLSFDVGPTLAEWLVEHEPAAWAGFVAGDRAVADRAVADRTATDRAATDRAVADRDPSSPAGRGNAMAQGFHHAILPLASPVDRRTEIRWGVRQFELRYGRRPVGFWLPETAVDLATLRDLAAEGIRHTILAPWQVADPDFDTRRPARIGLGPGHSIVVAVYDGGLSAAASFEPDATADADAFARERIAPRFASTPYPDSSPGVVVIATDGELYGHHRTFRDLFLDRLVDPGGDGSERGFDVVALASALEEPSDRPFPTVGLVGRTSWSCHHGIRRWSGECPCAPDGRWKAPLRTTLRRLADGVDAVIEDALHGLPGSPDPGAARDAYVDVVVGAEGPEAFAAGRLARSASPDDRRAFLELMDAARWRLAMFASDGWFWDVPDRPETRQVLRCAARAARLVDERTGSRLERRLVNDQGRLGAPSGGPDGAQLYRQALAEVGQPPPVA